MDRAPEPCEVYFGNVCSGFGGSLTCYMCGWDMYDHSPYKEEMERAFSDAED